MDYVVESESITGIRGAKYYKGQVVKVEFFHPGHASQLEKKGFISKKVSKSNNKDKS